MTLGSLLLVGFSVIAIVSAVFVVAIGRDERARARWMLVTLLALASVFVLIGAVPLALALLFVAAGQGLITFHAIGIVDELDDPDAGASAERRAVAPSHWLLIILGIGGGAVLANAVWSATASAVRSAGATPPSTVPAARFAEVAEVVLVEHGLATIFVALLLLAVTVVAGFLAVEEND